MFLGLTHQLIRFLTDLVLVRTRSDAQLRAEVLALRHQLRVLGQKVGKPAWQPGDRLLLAAISQLSPHSAWGLARLGLIAATASAASSAVITHLPLTGTDATSGSSPLIPGIGSESPL